MHMTLRDELYGAALAVALPRYTKSRWLLTLMEHTEIPPQRVRNDPQRAIDSGLFVLRHLSRLRTPFWRNTCLYRSVLQTVLLRRAGRSAVLRLGAAKGPSGSTVAHAWVEVYGEPMPEEGRGYTPLNSVHQENVPSRADGSEARSAP